MEANEAAHADDHTPTAVKGPLERVLQAHPLAFFAIIYQKKVTRNVKWIEMAYFGFCNSNIMSTSYIYIYIHLQMIQHFDSRWDFTITIPSGVQRSAGSRRNQLEFGTQLPQEPCSVGWDGPKDLGSLFKFTENLRSLNWFIFFELFPHILQVRYLKERHSEAPKPGFESNYTYLEIICIGASSKAASVASVASHKVKNTLSSIPNGVLLHVLSLFFHMVRVCNDNSIDTTQSMMEWKLHCFWQFFFLIRWFSGGNAKPLQNSPHFWVRKFRRRRGTQLGRWALEFGMCQLWGCWRVDEWGESVQSQHVTV